MRWWLLGLVSIGLMTAQTNSSAADASKAVWEMPNQGGLGSFYHTPEIPDVQLEDSPRVENLLRDGKLYLSLNDAIALALENNLDLELDRYGIKLADTDVLRSKSGSLPRGIPLSVRDSPAGLGAPVVGPNGTLGGGDTPALNSLIGPGVQIDLSVLGSLPLFTGPAIPNLDPQIVANASGSHLSGIQNTTFLPGLRSLNSNEVVANAGYQQGFTSGGTLDVFFDNSRLDQNNALLLYNPTVSSSAGISFTQPLLRGFGFAVNRRYIQIARNNRRVSDTVFEQQLITTVSGVVRLYWDLLSLIDDVRVREQGVASSEQFLKDTRNQLEAGTAADIDVTRAQAELSRRQRDLAVGRSLVRQQEIVLKDYVSKGRVEGPLATATVVAADKMPAPSSGPGETIDQLYLVAIKNRPDWAQVRIQLENAELSLKGSQNGLRPELDVVGTAEENGLGGRVVQAGAGDPLLTGGYGDALLQLVHNNFPSYSVGMQLTLPIRNRAARSDVLRDELTVRQQQIRIRQLEKQIRLEVTNASIALEQAHDTYEATKNERVFEEQALDAEQQKLEAGASTNYAVIQFQRDLTAARSAEISALASYQKAKTALQQATGTILADYQIMIGKALAGQAPQPVASPTAGH